MSSSEPASISAWIRLLRPRHWIKNLFVLAVPFFGGDLLEAQVWPGLGLAFLCFSLLASATYAMNDAADFESDRAHPRKRFRPVASGAVSPRAAVWLALLLGSLSLGLAFVVAPSGLFQVLLVYLMVNLLYSGGLKEWPVLDLLMVASGFVLRVLAGAAATGLRASLWLIGCTVLATFFLAAAKRRSERADSELRQADFFHHRPVLESYPGWLLEALCLGSGIAAALAFAAYAWLEHGGMVAILVAPLALAGLVRYQILTRPGSARSADGENPEELLWRDPLLLGLILAWVAMMGLSVYLTVILE